MAYTFEWDLGKELENVEKHGFSFAQAMQVFADPKVIHLEDTRHAKDEGRFYAVGKIGAGVVLTVRYTWRGKTIRLFGAANWRKWRKYYEENS